MSPATSRVSRGRPVSSRETSRGTSLVVMLFALVPLARLLRDLRAGFDHLMHARLCDDAFYYFEISRHIPFFNDGIPTTGFHPLYAFLVAPLHRSLDPEVAVAASVSLLVVAHSAGTFLIHALARRHFSPVAALAAAGTWALSGRLYSLAASGVETILAVIAVLGVLLLALPAREVPSLRKVAAVGVLGGAAFLARMDAPLVLAPAFAVLFVSLARRERIAHCTILALVPAAICLTWIGTMSAITGETLPTSAAAIRVHRGIDGVLATAPMMLAATGRLVRGAASFFVFAPVPWLQGLVFLTVAALGVAGVVVLRRVRPGRSLLVWAAVLATGVLLWSAYYLLILGGFRAWYFAYLAVPLYGFVVPVVVEAAGVVCGPRGAQVGAAAIVAIVALLSPARPFGPGALDKALASRALNAHLHELPAGARIGSFNTGIYDYFSDADIVNLDGVVNPGALRALRSGDLPGYLREKSISFLLEGEGDALLDALRDDARVRLVAVFDLREDDPPDRGQSVRDTFLWRVELAPGARP